MSATSANAAPRTTLLTVPNVISALRLPIAAAFFAVDGVMWRGVLLLLGALSDALDGWVARHLGLETETGAIVDPLFDKLFVLIVLAAFLAGPYLEWWEFAILISRDLYVAIGYLTARLRGLPIGWHPRPAGKLVTFLQLVTLFVLLLAPAQAALFIVAVGVASAVAIVDYTLVRLAELRGRSRAPG